MTRVSYFSRHGNCCTPADRLQCASLLSWRKFAANTTSCSFREVLLPLVMISRDTKLCLPTAERRYQYPMNRWHNARNRTRPFAEANRGCIRRPGFIMNVLVTCKLATHMHCGREERHRNISSVKYSVYFIVFWKKLDDIVLNRLADLYVTVRVMAGALLVRQCVRRFMFRHSHLQFSFQSAFNVCSLSIMIM